MPAIILCTFACAAAMPLVHRLTRDYVGVVAALVPIGVAVRSIHLRQTAPDAFYRRSAEWAPSLGVEFSFVLDGLSLVFVLLITLIGALVCVYAAAYLGRIPRRGEFFAYLLAFMGSMLGLVTADNVFLLFVFWELTGVTSFLLIGWNHDSAGAREAARTALLVTGGGGLMLLGGLVALSLLCGTAEFSQMKPVPVDAGPLGLFAVAMIFLGAFTKSAQFPFHFWLPGAMAAPTPVSAYLHSATMVKAGIYLLARVHPILGTADLWRVAAYVGGATMLVGAVAAVVQTDLKRILAYSTVSVLGTLTMLLGIGTPEAVSAAVTYLVAHSLYKGALFLTAGSVDHETGTRNIRRLGGLAKAMPLTATAAVVAGLSTAGIPPLFGFIAKELLYEAAWHAPGPALAAALTAAVFVASALMVVTALLVAGRPFFGAKSSSRTPPHEAAPHEASPHHAAPHEAPPGMTLGPLLLAIAGVAIGVAPGPVGDLLQTAATNIYGAQLDLKLALWHGLTPVLGLSVLTVLTGVGAYFALRTRPRLVSRARRLSLFRLQSVYDRAYAGLIRSSEAVTRVVQNGYLRNYVLVVVVTLLALLARPVLLGRSLFSGGISDFYFGEVIVAAVIFTAALAATAVDSRLAVAAILGVIGMSVMLIYVIFGALDLAVTQIMVETLSVIVLVLVLYHLPRFVFHSSRWIYVRDAVISVLFGGMIAMLVLEAFSVPVDPALRNYYAANSVALAHGRNVVNVILVDFRAGDTMGEVTVLAVAAVGVLALLRLGSDRSARPPAMVSVVLRTAAPVLMLLLLVVSMYALLRGHHESGGGFVGGLLAAAAFALHALAFDVASTRRLLRVTPRTLMGVGLLVMAAAGVAGLSVGDRFLQAQWIHAYLPGIGSTALGTPLLFDVGVLLTVMGMVLSIVLSAAEE